MWFRDTVHFKMRGISLLAFCLCGFIGILVDIDHPISYYLIPEWSGRFLHTPLLIASCLMLCCLGAYLGGLYLGNVLRTRKKVKLTFRDIV